jgi:predicted ester cyclase
MEKGIFLTVKDLMRLNGCNNEASAGRMHRAIRDSIAENKRKLTIKEYCQYERLDFKEIWLFLREGKYVNQ